MSYYKHKEYLVHNVHQAFDTITHPGERVPHSGIYRCEGCGHEIVSTEGHVMPPQNHHQHTPTQGKIRWKLIVATQ